MTSNNIFNRLKRLTNKKKRSNSFSRYDVEGQGYDGIENKQVTLKRYQKLLREDFVEGRIDSFDEVTDNSRLKQENCVVNDQNLENGDHVNEPKKTLGRDMEVNKLRWSDPPIQNISEGQFNTVMHSSLSLQAPLAYPENDEIIHSVDTCDTEEAVASSVSESATAAPPGGSLNHHDSGGDYTVEPGYQSIDDIKREISEMKNKKQNEQEHGQLAECSDCQNSHDNDKQSTSPDIKTNSVSCVCRPKLAVRDHSCTDSGVDSPGLLSSSPQSQSTSYSRYNSNNSSVLSEAEFNLISESEKRTSKDSKCQGAKNTLDESGHCHAENVSCEDNQKNDTGIVDKNLEELYAIPNKRKNRDCDSSEMNKLSLAAGPLSLHFIDSDSDEEGPPLPERLMSGSLPASPTATHPNTLAEFSSNPELWKGPCDTSNSHDDSMAGLNGSPDDVDMMPDSELGGAVADARQHRDLQVYSDSPNPLSSLSRSVPNIQRRRLPSPPSQGHRRTSSSGRNEPLSNNSESKGMDFFESLRVLKECGWYWGPLSWDDAESKLANKPDGSFLVRDSSDDRYILSLSFRSQSSTHHTRIEHHKGLFSFYSQPRSHGCGTIVDFIERAMTHSRNGKFLYFLRPRTLGYPPVPLQLLQPISRFQNMRSLQHMCRFVILKYVRKDHINRLPLPSRTKEYLMESQYYAETIEDDNESSDSTLTNES